MDQNKFLELLKQKVREAKNLDDIKAIFKLAFGLSDWQLLDFSGIVASIGNGDKPDYTKELAQYFENLDTQSAIEKVGQYFRAAFPVWRENPQGNLPLLVLDRTTGAEIGAKCQVVLLSPDTLKKQDEHHPELTQEDYEKAQETVEKGEKINQDARNIAFAMNKPNGVVVIVKATLIGDELYATSIRRLSSEEIKRESIIRRLRNRKSKQTDGGA